MKFTPPFVFENELELIRNNVTIDLITLLKRMQELKLTISGYKFTCENGDEVETTGVVIEENVLTFEVREALDDCQGYTDSVSSFEVPLDQLMNLYKLYHGSNVSTINSVDSDSEEEDIPNPMCKKYPDSEALPDDDGNCSLCNGDCVDQEPS